MHFVVMTRMSLRRVVSLATLSLMLAACGSTGGSASPPMPMPAPTPAPKPGAIVPAELSQSDAETSCLLQGSRKFGVPLKDMDVSGSKTVDAGFLVKLKVAGVDRSCIITKDGFVRSLR